MDNKAAIAALVEKLNGLSQDRALGDITTAEYWEQHQAISKQISKLRENQPSNFNSPIPERIPGELPFLRLREKLRNEYNQKRTEIRAGGIYDATGCRVKFVEKELNAIYARAHSKVVNARNIETLEHIETDTAKEVAKAMPFSKAA